MIKPAATILALAAFLAPYAVHADEMPYQGHATRAEQQFASAARADLMRRFATASEAERAGYVRYTGVDDTGAISYANSQWNSADVRHPSQLWYDSNGRLLGADYSVTVDRSATPPNLWGINPRRWTNSIGHVHWVEKDPASGKLFYDKWIADTKFAAAGGNPNHPTAAALAAMHKVPNASDVVHVIHFPAYWDLTVWIAPNPKGAFAYDNPNVKH